jgi:hypothetical protein
MYRACHREVVRADAIGAEIPRDAHQPASGQVAGGDHQRPGELFGLFAGAQVAEGAHAEVTKQTGEQLFEIGPPVHTVGQQKRESPADQRHLSNQIAVQELPIVDRAHDFREPGERFTGNLQRGDQRRDDRARAAPRNPRKPVARRGQRVHRSDQPNASDATAFAHQVNGRRAHGRHDSRIRPNFRCTARRRTWL